MIIFDIIPNTASGLAGALSVLAVTCFIGYSIYNLYLHPLAGYPGPKLAALNQVWYVYHWTSGRWPFILRELHKRYGDVVRIAPNELSFASVDSYRDIYGHASKTRRPFAKGTFYEQGMKYPSIIDANGEEHRAQRKALAHAFSSKALHDQEHVVQDYVDLFTAQLGAWSSRPEGFNIVEALNWITFDIIGELAFGESFKAVEMGKTHPWVSVLLDSVKVMDLIKIRKRMPLMNLVLPFLVSDDLKAKVTAHWDYTVKMTKKRIAKQDSITRADFFQHILQHGMMEEELLQQNSHILITAGSETTATALASCLFHLMHNDEHLSKLQKEVRDPFSSLDQITGESTQKLSYTHACIEEALRMYPPVPFGLPRASYGAPVDGHWVPAGTEVSSFSWSIKRDARYWKDPDSFRPERWIGDGFGDNKNAFNPFSLGPRACIGINLAYLEMRLILAKMVWSYDFELINKDLDWERDSMMYVLWNKPTMNIKFHPRKDVKV